MVWVDFGLCILQEQKSEHTTHIYYTDKWVVSIFSFNYDERRQISGGFFHKMAHYSFKSDKI